MCNLSFKNNTQIQYMEADQNTKPINLESNVNNAIEDVTLEIYAKIIITTIKEKYGDDKYIRYLCSIIAQAGLNGRNRALKIYAEAEDGNPIKDLIVEWL